MSKGIDRRAVLAGVFALGACAKLFPPPVYRVETTEAARQQLLGAVRAFGVREGLAFEDHTAAIVLLPFYSYILTGTRATLIFSSDINRPGVNVNFKAEFFWRDGGVPWSGGDDPNTLGGKFATAMSAVPGVTIERVARSQQSMQP